MRLRIFFSIALSFVAGSVFAQRNQQVDPVYNGDLVYLGPTASIACAAVTFFTGSDPCHVGMLTGSNTVTEATSGVEPNAVHTLTLTSFQSSGYKSAMTSYPQTPSSASRDTMLAYEAAKDARQSYYDANHLNQKGGYDGGCGYGVSGCWDGWDYFNEFDCVGLAERAYEVAATPDSEGLIPDYDPFNGCTWEGFFFIYPSDQYNSCKSTYPTAFPAVGAVTNDTVKHGFWKFYTLNIPSGVTSIAASTSSSTDIDLYIGELGFYPSLSSYACISDSSSGNEQCSISNPSAGTWGFGVYGFANTTSSFSIVLTQNGAPSAQSGLATSITSTSAQLHGSVTANGLSTTTAFDYGTTASYGQSVAAQSASGSSPLSIFANISALTCNRLYHFRARATNSGGSAYGGDLTFRTGNCAITFTDDPLVANGTVVKAIHVNELRAGINALRSGAGLTAFSFTETITAGVRVKASHILELRTALDQTRAALGLPQLSYTNAIIVEGAIRAIDIMEIRNALQ